MNTRLERFAWGQMEWLASADLGNARSLSVARMRVLAGQVTERHRHPNCDEVLVIERGSLQLELEGMVSRHGPGEHVVLPAGAAHLITSVGEEDLCLLVSYGSSRRVYERC